MSTALCSDDEDTVERAYWQNLMQKAVNSEYTKHDDHNDGDGDISSTQDETDLSSFTSGGGSANLNKMIAQARDKLGKKNQRETHIKEVAPFTKVRPSASRPIVDDCGPTESAVVVRNQDPVKIKEVKPAKHQKKEVKPKLHKRKKKQTEISIPLCDSAPEPELYQTPRVELGSSNAAASTTTPVPSVVHIYEDDSSDCSSTTTKKSSNVIVIMDATEPLVYKQLDDKLHDSKLIKAANRLHELLQQHVDAPEDTKLINRIFKRIIKYPEACQIRYPDIFRDEEAVCFPLTYFCITGCMALVKAAYRAFPEAIACVISTTGTPLHYACQHGASLQVVDFLLNKFGEAARGTNKMGQTPLHLACRATKAQAELIAKLLQHQPNAAQLTDKSGDTPLHTACRRPTQAATIVPLLLKASPSAISAVTADTQKPLHVAVAHGCPKSVIELLLKHDGKQARCLDDAFQTPLHKAVEHYCHSAVKQYATLGAVIQLLVAAYPDALKLTDELNDTPADIALLKLNPHRVKTILPLLQH